MQGIADNVLRNHARRWARRRRSEVQLNAQAVPAGPVAPALSSALTEHVAVALAGLPDTYRDVLRAKYAEGHSVAEIAAACDKTPKAVESLLTRARAAFRKAFGELHQEKAK